MNLRRQKKFLKQEMKIIKINIGKPAPKAIQRVISALKTGKCAVIPTDTAYGLCADATNKEAVDKIYKIKKREKNKPISVFVKNLAMIEKIADISRFEKEIIEKNLPDAYTFILRKRKDFNEYASCKGTIGVRWIKSEIYDEIFRYVDFPITATSANIAAEEPVYNARGILKKFKNKKHKPDIIVDAGKLEKAKPSTIVDLTASPPKILRQGGKRFEV